MATAKIELSPSAKLSELLASIATKSDELSQALKDLQVLVQENRDSLEALRADTSAMRTELESEQLEIHKKLDAIFDLFVKATGA